MKKKIGLLVLLVIGIVGTVILSANDVNAENSNDKYSIDYLLRHYNAVTFGTKENNILTEYKQKIQGTNKGDIKNLTVEGPVLARGEYANKVNENVDFDKMYAQVMNESQMLVDKTEYHINDHYVHIDKPGIYMINNAGYTTHPWPISIYDDNWIFQRYVYYNEISIENYDPDELYVFNVMDSFSTSNFRVSLISKDNSFGGTISDVARAGKYSGNIIFNYPNARYIHTNNLYGSIISPKADVFLDIDVGLSSPFLPRYGSKDTRYGSILANSISNADDKSVHFTPYVSSKKILDKTSDSYINELNDYNDDIYYGDYSISTLLQNYNIVSLGQKEYENNTKFKSLGYNKGSTAIFHIASQFLVNGDFGTTGENYPGFNYSSYGSENNKMRLDLESNIITESSVNGIIKTGYYIKNWKTGSYQHGSRNRMFINSTETNELAYADGGYNGEVPFHAGHYNTTENYINYNRLYNNIVKEQNSIEEGSKVTSKDGVVHVKVGGIYTIEDISDVNEIMFEKFDENKDKLTIITIKNAGNINFPLISKDTGDYKGIPTNDYYGKTVANQEYEMGGLLPDEYHGNIVFNVPNANYIKLAPNAPFAGHLIAPNADVETEETQLAGCMIVNSLYAEGGSEAHFYPLTATATYEVPEYNDLTESEKTTLGAMRLKRLLGGSASTIETTVLGDETEFRKEEAKLNEILDKEQNKTSNNTIAPIIDILQNPLTKRSVLIIGSILTIISVTIYFTFKKKA